MKILLALLALALVRVVLARGKELLRRDEASAPPERASAPGRPGRGRTCRSSRPGSAKRSPLRAAGPHTVAAKVVMERLPRWAFLKAAALAGRSPARTPYLRER